MSAIPTPADLAAEADSIEVARRALAAKVRGLRLAHEAAGLLLAGAEIAFAATGHPEGRPAVEVARLALEAAAGRRGL